MDFAFVRTALLHNKSSYPPPGLAFGELDDRLQRVSSTPRLCDFIISVSGIPDRRSSRAMTAGMNVIASGAKQSIATPTRKLDCFVAALLAMTSRHAFAISRQTRPSFAINVTLS